MEGPGGSLPQVQNLWILKFSGPESADTVGTVTVNIAEWQKSSDRGEQIGPGKEWDR